jgi:hypothetical protein
MTSDSPPLFLTDAELEFMSGYKQPAAQIRWLQKWRIRHVVNAAGYPRVTRAAVEGTEKTGPERPRATPNFEALDKLTEELTKNSMHWYYRKRRKEMGIPEPPTVKPTPPTRPRSRNKRNADNGRD